MEETKAGVLLTGILNELRQQQIKPLPTYNDNQSSTQLGSAYNGNHKKVRYMPPKVNWLMEKVKTYAIKLTYLSTDKLPLDLGTKIHTDSAHRLREAAVMGY